MPPPTDALAGHLATVLTAWKRGELVPFLGAGANLCGRPDDADTWNAEQRHYLPSGAELSRYLAAAHDMRNTGDDDLVSVAQAIAVTWGSGPMYASLRKVFNADWPPTPLHELLARLPKVFAANGWPPLELIVTTNYDDVLERAFRAAGTDVDVVTYMARGRHEGMFIHIQPDGKGEPITEANVYPGLAADDEGRLLRPVVLKLHGAIDRSGRKPDLDTFVITEDDYIAYLSQFDVSALVPGTLVAKLVSSGFLFMGYSLRDWNVRAILHRIWEAQQGKRFGSWSVQKSPDDLERLSWQHRGVEIIAATLDDYVAAMGAALDGAKHSGSTRG